MKTAMIQIKFSEDVVVNGRTIKFNDALYYTPEQYETTMEEYIDSAIQARVANFKNAVENPPKPTKEELEKSKKELEDLVTEMESPEYLTSKIAEVNSRKQSIQTEIDNIEKK